MRLSIRVFVIAAVLGILLLVATVAPLAFAGKKVPPLPEKPSSRTFSRNTLSCLEQRVRTSNPSATPETKQLLAYLRELPQRPDRRIISGQFIGGGDWSGLKEVTQVRDRTQKWVGMIGNDYALMHDTSIKGNAALLNYWKDGGLVTISFHQLNPERRKFGSVKSRKIDFAALLNPQSDSYRAWIADMDRVAVGLAQLQEYGVVVLWRPYHEMNKNFFWWGQRDVADFVKLWRNMYNYLTHDKKLNNLLWVYSPYQAQDTDKYYPGDDYVDIVSMDAYETNPEKIEGYEQLTRIDKPFGFGEYGPSGSLIVVFPKVDKNVDYNQIFQSIKTRFPKTTFIHAWNGPWGFQGHRNIEQMMNDPWMITREKLDWQKICEEGAR